MIGLWLAGTTGSLIGLVVGWMAREDTARAWRDLYHASREELGDERERAQQLAREVNAANAEARATRRLEDGGTP